MTLTIREKKMKATVVLSTPPAQIDHDEFIVWLGLSHAIYMVGFSYYSACSWEGGVNRQNTQVVDHNYTYHIFAAKHHNLKSIVDLSDSSSRNNKSSKDRTWPAVPDALLGVIG